jgi:hypothetical protein
MGGRERDLLHMRDFVNILQHAGFILYALPILWCTIVLVRSPGVENTVGPLRLYRRLGPLLGISLGMCIVGAIAGFWLDHSTFDLDWSTAPGRRELATIATFFIVWVSNIKLEIWTLEPVRKLDNNAPHPPVEMEQFGLVVGALKKHIALHSIGLISVAILSSCP